MKPFNLEEYIKNPSKKVITRDGRNVTIHCTNCVSIQPVVAEVEGDNYSTYFCKDGRYLINPLIPSINDLFFVTEKYEGWINIFSRLCSSDVGPRIFKAKEDAEKVAKIDSDYVTTIKIEWEE